MLMCWVQLLVVPAVIQCCHSVPQCLACLLSDMVVGADEGRHAFNKLQGSQLIVL